VLDILPDTLQGNIVRRSIDLNGSADLPRGAGARAFAHAQAMTGVRERVEALLSAAATEPRGSEIRQKAVAGIIEHAPSLASAAERHKAFNNAAILAEPGSADKGLAEQLAAQAALELDRPAGTAPAAIGGLPLLPH
jgi:hypothetical protein